MRRAVAAVALTLLVAGCATFPDNGPREWREKIENRGELGGPPTIPDPQAPPTDPDAPGSPGRGGQSTPQVRCPDPDPQVVATCLEPVGAVAPLPGGFPIELGLMLRYAVDRNYDLLLPTMEQVGFIQKGEQVSEQEIEEMLRQYVEPVQVEVFHFTRKWLQKVTALDVDRSVQQIRTVRHMDLPRQLAIPMRVIASVVAISETLALDLRDAGAGNVKVSVLSPAFFPTAIVDSARNRPAELADTATDLAPLSVLLRQIRTLIRPGTSG